MKFSDYCRAGWKLCGIDRAQKSPRYGKWNENPIPEDAVDGLESAGLLHALSGTCCLDLDQITLAKPWLAERGIDLDALFNADNAVIIDSGRPGRAKLLYALKRPLRTLMPKGSGLELRCATLEGKSVQDALPPSVHPKTGKPYQWGGGILSDWANPPPIPAALLGAWRALISEGVESPVIPKPDDRPAVDLVKLHKAAFKHSPDCEYEEWLKVGMQLNDGTHGAQEGFDIWREWSKGIKRAEYPGEAVLKSHWLSFGSSPGKRVASGESLAAELPADAEDFEIMAAPAADLERKAQAKLAASIREANFHKLVERFVFVIWEQEYFDTERNVIIGDKAIKHLLTPYMPRKNGKELDPVDALMRARQKDAVESLAFHPGEQSIFLHQGRRYANTYHDSGLPAVEPMADEQKKIDWLFNRIDDLEYRTWLKQFFAHMVQRPGIKIRSAPLIWSKTQGNGKSTLVGTIPKLLVSENYYVEVTSGMLNSDHNDYLIGKWHVTLAEFRAGTRGERESISKKVENWIADDILSIHPKGTKAYSIPNHLVVTASTNKDDAALIDANDRKWAVHVLSAPKMTGAEKEWLFTQYLRTDRAAPTLRYYFLHVDLTGFDPHADAPRTAARQAMIGASTAQDTELLLAAFEERSEPLSRDAVLIRDVGDDVRRRCSSKPLNDRVTKLLCDKPINGKSMTFKARNGQYRGVVLTTSRNRV